MLMASFLFTHAQTSVNAAGGDISDVTGSLSHSIGQTTYKTVEATGDMASRIQGVQVPFEYYLQYCPEDINQDGLVDILDFLELNSAYSSACICREDIDRDGIVGVADFISLNSAYGNPCRPTP